MNPQDKIQNKLEIVFNKYKLTPEQKAQVAFFLLFRSIFKVEFDPSSG
jgi:hypothetical protein